MSKQKTDPVMNPAAYNGDLDLAYGREEINNVIYRSWAGKGVDPKSIPDLKARKAYIAYLKKKDF